MYQVSSPTGLTSRFIEQGIDGSPPDNGNFRNNFRNSGRGRVRGGNNGGCRLEYSNGGYRRSNAGNSASGAFSHTTSDFVGGGSSGVPSGGQTRQHSDEWNNGRREDLTHSSVVVQPYMVRHAPASMTKAVGGLWENRGSPDVHAVPEEPRTVYNAPLREVVDTVGPGGRDTRMRPSPDMVISSLPPGIGIHPAISALQGTLNGGETNVTDNSALITVQQNPTRLSDWEISQVVSRLPSAFVDTGECTTFFAAELIENPIKMVSSEGLISEESESVGMGRPHLPPGIEVHPVVSTYTRAIQGNIANGHLPNQSISGSENVSKVVESRYGKVK